jgi:DNA topoisomerase-3
MGDQNVEFFTEIYRLLASVYPQEARLCDESVITKENKNIFNSAALEDHHALIPLRQIPENADAQERNIFDIVLKAFFAVCMNDYVYNKKRLLFHIGNYILRSQLNEVLQYGFKKTIIEAEDNDDDVQEIGNFNEKTCKVSEIALLNKKTKPKKEFSIDTLLGFMENPYNSEDKKLAGLGTPATRAAIIKLLFDRQYIREERKKLYASRKGLFLLEQLQKNRYLNMIADLSQTTEWENQLLRNPQEFEKNILHYLRDCVASSSTERYAPPPIGVCPRCGNAVLEGKKSYYCSGYKHEKQCSFSIFKRISGASLSTEEVTLLLSQKSTGIKSCVSKLGKKFKAAFSLNRDGTIVFQFDNQIKGGKFVSKQTKRAKHGN